MRNETALPRPEFYVFYNGDENCPKESEMNLSDAFKTFENGEKAVNLEQKETQQLH
ncbi:hypothetical protein [uncultured Treponema sp.]|uniref:hypothetical protein n=1 Tax=uncultured Treponema sp. TaxID=162155 RepID=UPI0025FC692C|nr:hypothetical protein [uncultured Treponema sp.]